MSMTMVLDPDENGKAADQREYRSMIGYLLYLTTTWPEIHFAICMGARFKASPHTLHWQAVQQIFRYLKYTLEFGIWYSASSSLDLVGFSDANFVGCGIDRKKTLLLYVIFLDLLLFVCLLTNKQLLHNPPQRSSM
jgi:hypothetical protein